MEPWKGVSRSGERPEPTVTVRMKENVQRVGLAVRLPVIALGDVSCRAGSEKWEPVFRDRQQATKLKGDHDDTHPLCFCKSQLAFRYR